ncbi:MAG: hypothetical protein OEW36_13960 [Hylemonella sp.]|nr:hypothetical protein [Hylemonella sp.]
MSPSWTRVLDAAPACRVGIAIGRRELAAVVVAGGGAPEPLALQCETLAAQLFDAPPGAAAEDALVQALRAVSASWRDAFAAVHVALPDSVLRSAVLELDQLPAKASLRQALLRWRLAKQWQRSEDSLDCRSVALGPDGTQQLLFGQGGDQAWLACVRRALARAGVRAWSLNAAAVHRFNAFHDTLAAAPGALLTLDPDDWSLLLWDEQGRLRQLLTRLRPRQPAAEAAPAIADEVERAILTYVQAAAGRQVLRLHLAGDHADVAALAAVFDARMREPARPLQPLPHTHTRTAGLHDGLAPLALAAALNR